jgi:hypothetical protein
MEGARRPKPGDPVGAAGRIEAPPPSPSSPERRCYLSNTKDAFGKGWIVGLSDPNYVATQYRNASNLNLRITLYQRFTVNKEPRHRHAFEHMNPPPAVRILELDRGTAALWIENLGKIPEMQRTILTDSSPAYSPKRGRA